MSQGFSGLTLIDLIYHHLNFFLINVILGIFFLKKLYFYCLFGLSFDKRSRLSHIGQLLDHPGGSTRDQG